MPSPSTDGVSADLARTQEIALARTEEFRPLLNLRFESPDEAAVYTMVWHEVDALQGRTRGHWLGKLSLLIASLGLFLIVAQSRLELHVLLTLVGALFLHELGHFLGMVGFGYRDVRMFFVPFFGAGVSGTKHAAPAWQRAIVLLLGPLPGIAIGAAGLLLWPTPRPPAIEFALTALVVLNVLNLIPVEPFDGGKLAHLLVFSRHVLLEVGFLVLAVAVLAGVGWWTGQWLLAAIGGFLLLGIIPRHVRANQVADLRRQRPRMAERLTELTEGDKIALFRAAVQVEGGPGEGPEHPWPNPKATARSLMTLHEAAVHRPPGWPAAAGFLGLAVLGWALAVLVVLTR